jgi:hypothetical protein
VVDHLSESAPAAKSGMAYIYFDYKEEQNQNPSTVLASLIKQLVLQLSVLPPHLDALYNSSNDKGLSRPSCDSLYSALVDTSKSFQQVFLVFDALDECNPQERQREALLSLLTKLGGNGSRFKLFVTSRPDPADIQQAFGAIPRIDVSAHAEDIEGYIHERLGAYPGVIGHEREHEFVSCLVEAAGGM